MLLVMAATSVALLYSVRGRLAQRPEQEALTVVDEPPAEIDSELDLELKAVRDVLERSPRDALQRARHILEQTLATDSPDRRLAAHLTRSALSRFRGRILFDDRAHPARSVDISESGRTIVAASRNKIFVWRRRGAPQILPLESAIHEVRISPNEKWLVAGTEGGKAWLWQLDGLTQDSRPIRLGGHRHTVHALAFSPDQRWLATASDRPTVRVWDLASMDGEPRVLTPADHRGDVAALRFTPTGGALLTGSSDGQIRLWRVPANAGKIRTDATFRVVGSSRTAINDMSLCSSLSTGRNHPNWLVTGTSQGHVELRNLNRPATMREPIALTDGQGEARLVRFMSDCRYAVSAGARGRIQLWNLKPRDPAATGVVLPGDTEGFTVLAIGERGSTLALGSASGSVHLWDVDRPQQQAVHLVGHAGQVLALAMTADGRWLVSSGEDGTVRLWDASSSGQGSASHLMTTQPAPVSAVAVLGEHIISGNLRGELQAWSMHAAPSLALTSLVDSQRAHTRSVTALAVDPQGQWVASASVDHTVRVWQVSKGALRAGSPLLHESAVTNVAFSPNGAWLATTAVDGTVRLWPRAQVTKGTPTHVLEGDSAELLALTFNRASNAVYAAGVHGRVYRWDLKNLSPETPSTTIATLGHSTWKLQTSPDGHWLAALAEDDTVHLWSLTKNHAHRALEGHLGRLRTLAISEDGRWIASGARERDVLVWDLEDPNTEPMRLTGHQGHLDRLAFTGTAPKLLSVDSEGVIRMWTRDAKRFVDHPPLGTLEGRALGFTIDPTGQWLLTGDDSGALRLWPITATSLLQLARHVGDSQNILAPTRK